MKLTLNADFLKLKEKYPNIYLIVSPPRCSSTAFARVFWEHKSIRYYSHEPFETTYYENKGLDDVYQRIAAPLDLLPIKYNATLDTPKDIVIKEMPYQVGGNFELAANLAQKPIVFLIRDPRLNIESRINKKLEVGDSPFFPLQETGWELINQQINHCKSNSIPYIIVDAADFRNEPEAIFRQVFEKFDLDFSATQLNWKADERIEIDNLAGAHTHLYKKVLGSKGIRPATEVIPAIETFTEEHNIRTHVKYCMNIYKTLRADKNLILPN